MTGHEEKGFCFWCGLTCGHKRFCNTDCKTNYHRHFVWENARNWCLKRADYKCEKCGVKQNYYGWSGDPEAATGDFGTRLEAHHIEPLNNEYRHYNKKNRPENLICLCNRCHSRINRLEFTHRLESCKMKGVGNSSND